MVSCFQAADGYVHFGDVIQIATADAKAVIAIDTEDKVLALAMLNHTLRFLFGLVALSGNSI